MALELFRYGRKDIGQLGTFVGANDVNAASPARIRVFVQLARGFGAHHWKTRWTKGEIIGLNDCLPYGYFWAEKHGCIVEYSEDKRESRLGAVLRLGVRAALGFDYVHAWRNRRGIFGADVVWTHTESQYLAVLLLRGRPRSRRPKVIAQSVWLFDRWCSLSAARRWFYRKLMLRADILTVLSPENLRRAREIFPTRRAEMVLFGVCTEHGLVREFPPMHSPVRILSLGNDRHRDWPTLVAAVKGWDACCLRIASATIDRRLAENAPSIEIVRPKRNEELLSLYDWADIAVVPLRSNLHASGITVVEEAITRGVPVICTDTGGLTAYFAVDEVKYVPEGQPGAIRDAITVLANDDRGRDAMVKRAQARVISAGLTSRDFARRHAELSRELLAFSDEAVPERKLSFGCALFFAAVMTVSLSLDAQAAPAPAKRLDLCAFDPTFTEDFDTLSVSPHGENGSRWIAHTPWNGDFGDAAFADPGRDFPFRVKNGVLEIEARKNADGKWQSGLLASVTPTGSGFSQRYGYFEMRAQLPPGPGTWPAFWLNSVLPQGSQQPGVEIDVIEYYGQFNNAYHSTVHIWDNVDSTKSTQTDHVTNVWPGSLVTGFHNYGVDVEKDAITFYLDRRETWRTPTPPELQAPLMILVNLALGSGWPIDKTLNPSVMKVDYIHAFARRPPAEAASCSPRVGQ
ncbi:MAG TPA: family 16 glycosylhydrolase [Stellaceae bacterium]|nr:family 16 glycosylhydrolase [Stellaceae bacterium]